MPFRRAARGEEVFQLLADDLVKEGLEPGGTPPASGAAHLVVRRDVQS
jgi:hypothetical protein